MGYADFQNFLKNKGVKNTQDLQKAVTEYASILQSSNSRTSNVLIPTRRNNTFAGTHPSNQNVLAQALPAPRAIKQTISLNDIASKYNMNDPAQVQQYFKEAMDVQKQNEAIAKENQSARTQAAKTPVNVEQRKFTGEASDSTLGYMGEKLYQGAKDAVRGIKNTLATTGITNYGQDTQDAMRKQLEGATIYKDQGQKLLDMMTEFQNDVKIQKTAKAEQYLAENAARSSMERQYLEDKYANVDGFGRFMGTAMEGTGQMLPAIGLSMLTGGAGGLASAASSASFFATAKGNSMAEAVSQGADLKTAEEYGNMSALSETIIEWASGGIGGLNTKQGLAGVLRKATDTRVGKAVANNAFIKNVNKWLMSEPGKWLTSRISGMTGEGVEEIVSEYVGPLLQRATYDPEANMPTMDDVKQAFMGGFGAAGIMGVSHDALNGRMLKDPARFEPGKVEKFDVWDDVDEFDANRGENSAAQTGIIPTGVNMRTAGERTTITPQEFRRMNEKDQERTIRIAENAKELGVAIDVSDYITRVANAYDIEVEFSELPAGKNGLYKDGKIIMSPKAERPANEILKHEVTHHMEGSKYYGELQKFAEQYWNKDGDFQQAVEVTMKLYEDAGIPLKREEAVREVVADTTAELLSDEDFLKIAQKQNAGMVQHIYDWIKTQIQKIKHRNDPEFKELLEVQKMYERVMKTSKDRGTGETSFSIKQDADGKRYVSIDQGQDVFDNAKPSQYSAIARKVIREKFAGKQWPMADHDIARVTNRTASEYSHPATALTHERSNSKMRASAELDNLLSTSKYAYSAQDDGRHGIASLGWDYYETEFEVNGKRFTGLLNVATSPSGRVLYDITKIKEVQRGQIKNRAANGQQSDQASPMDNSPTNNISKTAEKVNDTTVQFLDDEIAGNHEGDSAETVAQKIGEDPAFKGAESIPLFNSYDEAMDYRDEVLRKREQSDDGQKSIGPGTRELLKRYAPNTERETPMDIASLKKEDANTTPKLKPSRSFEEKKAKEGDRKSKFAKSVQNSSILSDEVKQIVRETKGINTYDRITNRETLEAANEALDMGGQKYVNNWFAKDRGGMDALDITTGIILLDRYQAVGDYESAVNVIQKLRSGGTQAGQAVQAFSLLSRLTPEGMLVYAQKSLDAAFEEMVKKRSAAWIEANQDKFKLNAEDAKFISEKTLAASKLPDGRDKQILIGEIAARIQNKIPASGQALKAMNRISLLLNVPTNVRNILGNAVMLPRFLASDFIAAGIDKKIGGKTGERTKGLYGPQWRGFKKGLSESFDDFRRGINTRLIQEGGRFELPQGKSFNDQHTGPLKTPRNALARAMNGLDRLTTFALDAGDRPFFEFWFMNSIEGQKRANLVKEPTTAMIQIAMREALQRTWQDTNRWTNTASSIRKLLNVVKVGRNYGLGDVVLKFCQTPANLAKAMVDFSPIGAIKALVSDGRKLKSAMERGKTDAGYKDNVRIQQHEYVKNLANGITGTLFMAAWLTLMSTGVVDVSGKGDDDKDVADFMKNVMGIQPYSIKLGGKRFDYTWAQPIGSQLAALADIKSLIDGETPTTYFDGDDGLQKAGNYLVTGLEAVWDTFVDQSFMQGVQNLFESDSFIAGLIESSLGDVSSFVPAISNQAADIMDDTARSSYNYKDPVGTAVNRVKARIPGQRETLAPQVDVLGREVSSTTSPLEVLLSPAKANSVNSTKEADEMYRLYDETKDAGAIAPKSERYYKSNKTDKMVYLDAYEYADMQKTMGEIATDGLDALLGSSAYKRMKDEDKVEVVKKLYSYAKQKAKVERGDYTYDKTNQKVADAEKKGINPAIYFLVRAKVDSFSADKGKNGKTIPGSKKKKVMSYLNSLGLSKNQYNFYMDLFDYKID